MRVFSLLLINTPIRPVRSTRLSRAEKLREVARPGLLVAAGDDCRRQTRQTRPISHLAGDRARFVAPRSMELIKRAICSGPFALRGRQQRLAAAAIQDARESTRQNLPPVARRQLRRRRRRLGRNLHDLISLRLTPRATPVTLSLSMRAPCGGSNHSRDDPFYPRLHLAHLVSPARALFLYAAQPTPAARISPRLQAGSPRAAHPSFRGGRSTPRPSAPLVLRRALYVGKFAIFPFNISTPRAGGRHTI